MEIGVEQCSKGFEINDLQGSWSIIRAACAPTIESYTVFPERIYKRATRINGTHTLV